MDIFVALYIFILTAFTGYQLISKVSSTLHAPLLSASIILHGVVLIGAMIIMSNATTTSQSIIGFIAVTLATANVVGGYMITKKLLNIFTKDRADVLSGDK